MNKFAFGRGKELHQTTTTISIEHDYINQVILILYHVEDNDLRLTE